MSLFIFVEATVHVHIRYSMLFSFLSSLCLNSTMNSGEYFRRDWQEQKVIETGENKQAYIQLRSDCSTGGKTDGEIIRNALKNRCG